MALEPEDLHLALDTGIGVVVSVAGQRPPVLSGEGEGAHDESTRCGSQIVPRPQFTAMRSHLQFVPGQAKPSITAPPTSPFREVSDPQPLPLQDAEPLL